MITWEKQENRFGFLLEFYIMHGDADFFNTESIFLKNEKELEECISFAKSLANTYPINHSIKYDENDESISIKKMSLDIKKETKLNVEKIKKWLEEVIVEDMNSCGNSYAECVAFRIKKINEEGLFQGIIDGKKYVSIGRIHKDYLEGWK